MVAATTAGCAETIRVPLPPAAARWLRRAVATILSNL
jgi:hypothetical protein